MAFVMVNLEVDDFDTWKQQFDADPVGRKQVAKGHVIYQAAGDPNHVFVATEFASADDASAFRERLVASGVLGSARAVHVQPTVTELAEATTY
jgi:hypothetical protein